MLIFSSTTQIFIAILNLPLGTLHRWIPQTSARIVGFVLTSSMERSSHDFCATLFVSLSMSVQNSPSPWHELKNSMLHSWTRDSKNHQFYNMSFRTILLFYIKHWSTSLSQNIIHIYTVYSCHLSERYSSQFSISTTGGSPIDGCCHFYHLIRSWCFNPVMKNVSLVALVLV